MVKRIGRRFVSLLLTFVTVLTLLPAMTLPALAVNGSVTGSLSDTNIVLSCDGDMENSWNAHGMTISGTITGKRESGCNKSQSSTLTIKNNSGKMATLSFDYTIVFNEGSVAIAGEAKKQNGNFRKTLGKNASITVQITSGEGTDKTTTIEMTNVNLETEQVVAVTFQPAENGSYTVDGEPITEDRNYNRSSTSPYLVKAIPNEGYQFLGWYDVSNGTYLPGKANGDIYVSLNNSKVTAIFKEKGTTFREGISDLIWDDLNDAILSASNNNSGQVTLLKSCTISGEYTIPRGITLLIPCDDAHTVYREKPGTIGNKPAEKNQAVYAKLTMGSGAKLVVNGELSVAAQVSSANASYTSVPTGKYGQVEMQEGASIVLESGSSLYCWGFITGKGNIVAKSGAKVYEEFQIADHRGGDKTLTLNTAEKTFPFSQYYVQNIEARLEIQYGAIEEVVCRMYATSSNSADVTLHFIAKDNGGLFNLTGENSKFVKWYDPKTERVNYEVYDDAKLSSISLTMTVIFPVKVDSAKFNLPIMQNTTINVKSGTTTIDQNLCMIPGSQVIIDEGAAVNIANGKSVFVYDRSDWVYKEWDTETINVNGQKIPKYANSGFTYPGSTDFKPEYYTPSRSSDNSKCWTSKFTTADMKDVKWDVNGTLNVAGKLYTTKGGADITSSLGSGKVVLSSAAPTDVTTYQYMQSRKTEYNSSTKKYDKDASGYKDITATPAKLHNLDNSYTPTAGSSAGATFTYCTGSECGGGKWVQNLQVAEIVKNDGTHMDYPTLQEAVKQFPQGSSGNTYIKMLHSTTQDIPTENITTNKDLYLDLNGCTVKGDISVTDNHKLYGMDSSAKADYTTAPTGKIVGTVKDCAPTYQTPGDTNDRYVAIQGLEEDGRTENLSFHRFNISVTGYRFELTTSGTPQCALFFIGKFQGDDAAKKYLSKLGFTLKDENDTQLGKADYEFTADTVIPEMPADGEESDSEVVCSGDAYLFEAYLMRSFNKNDTAAYRTKISATAQATFDNGGKQDSEPKLWSFEDAWTNPGELDPAQQKILDKFLKELGITKQAE